MVGLTDQLYELTENEGDGKRHYMGRRQWHEAHRHDAV